ncbi:MAG: flagellar biosynthetic protein FliP, partial [Pseudomonadota bacterium]
HEILSTWMLQSINPDTLAALFRISGETPPTEIESVSFQYLVPAFMLSELEFAFKAAFFVMVPFLLVDLAVASILMSLGIIMLPPITVSLPIKIMLFVLVDGWTLIGITVAESALT